MRLVTLCGECFDAELRSADEYQERDGLVHKFYLTDLVSGRGKLLSSVFVSGTLAAAAPNFRARVEVVRLNVIRRALDAGVLNFDGPLNERDYVELSLSEQDFETQAGKSDSEIRRYIFYKAYWLAYRFPTLAQAGILYPIPFDEPADLDYLGVTPSEMHRNIQRMANQGLLDKVLEGHARPTERLLSKYESGDGLKVELAGQTTAATASPNNANDRKFARLAVDEAAKSVPEDRRVHPKVGVVVVKDGRVLATAHRGEIPQCHAEFIALEKKLADVSLSGATVYTTLEPCTTRTHPKIPCAARLTERKVSRVVIGMLDPDNRISGRGLRSLRKAGIVTDLFQHDLMTEIEELNRDFVRDRESSDDAEDERRGQYVNLNIPALPKVRVTVKQGLASNFLLEYASDESEPVFIQETRLFAEGVELTEPLVPDNSTAWMVSPHGSRAFGKSIVHQRNPAASLVKMNSNRGISFETKIDVMVSYQMRDKVLEARQTLYVKVNGTNNEIVHLV